MRTITEAALHRRFCRLRRFQLTYRIVTLSSVKPGCRRAFAANAARRPLTAPQHYSGCMMAIFGGNRLHRPESARCVWRNKRQQTPFCRAAASGGSSVYSGQRRRRPVFTAERLVRSRSSISVDVTATACWPMALVSAPDAVIKLHNSAGAVTPVIWMRRRWQPFPCWFL